MSNIISIHSFHGGVGKSTIAAGVAVALASTGKRVGVVDADLQSPVIHHLLALPAKRIQATLNTYLTGDSTIAGATYEINTRQLKSEESSVKGPGGTGLYITPACEETGEILRILREGYHIPTLSTGMTGLVKELELDFLVVDTPTGLNDETLVAMAVADLVLIVMQPGRFGGAGIQTMIEVAHQVESPQVKLIANMTLPGVDVSHLCESIEHDLKTPVASVLPFSMDLFHQEGMIHLLQPDHPLSQPFQDLSSALFDGENSS